MNEELIRLIKKSNLDGLLITNPFNITYLSDFVSLSPTERESYILITKNGTYFFTNALYFDSGLVEKNNLKQITSLLLSHETPISEHVKNLCKKHSIKKLGVEGTSLTYDEYVKLSKELGVEIISSNNLVEQMRMIKKEDEIGEIKKACQLTDRCLKEMIPALQVGQSEAEVEWRIEQWAPNHGKTLAFAPTIVAVNANSALPHHRSGKVKIKKNSVVLIDMGIAHEGYVSDITRMVFFGKPEKNTAETYHKLLAVQNETIHHVSQVSDVSEIDIYCRDRMKMAGLPACPHSTGHGIGLEIHETPHVSFKVKQPLLDSMVFTIEPGVYLDGRWGMRIEDSVLFKNGKVEVLTKFPKEMLIL